MCVFARVISNAPESEREILLHLSAAIRVCCSFSKKGVINGAMQNETCLDAVVLCFGVFYLCLVNVALLCDEQTPALIL